MHQPLLVDPVILVSPKCLAGLKDQKESGCAKRGFGKKTINNVNDGVQCEQCGALGHYFIKYGVARPSSLGYGTHIKEMFRCFKLSRTTFIAVVSMTQLLGLFFREEPIPTNSPHEEFCLPCEIRSP